MNRVNTIGECIHYEQLSVIKQYVPNYAQKKDNIFCIIYRLNNVHIFIFKTSASLKMYVVKGI